MPRCLRCGNNLSFYSSQVPRRLPVTGAATGGLAASFDGQGRLVNMEDMGGGPETLEMAWRQPEYLIDRCGNCGSGQLAW